jgi:hypothetical protein
MAKKRCPYCYPNIEPCDRDTLNDSKDGVKYKEIYDGDEKYLFDIHEGKGSIRTKGKIFNFNNTAVLEVNVEITGQDGWDKATIACKDIKINYCPICGRKLSHFYKPEGSGNFASEEELLNFFKKDSEYKEHK